MREFD